MIEISGEIKILLIGWVLGIFTSIIEPFIITPIKKWQDKRNFKKILKEDIKIKVSHLKSIEQSITEFFNGENRDAVLFGLISTNKLTDLPVIHIKVSEDFYNTNYMKFLEYFGKETNLLKFYRRISTLNSIVEIMGNYPGTEHSRAFLKNYFGHLKTALNEGKNIVV